MEDPFEGQGGLLMRDSGEEGATSSPGIFSLLMEDPFEGQGGLLMRDRGEEGAPLLVHSSPFESIVSPFESIVGPFESI